MLVIRSFGSCKRAVLPTTASSSSGGDMAENCRLKAMAQGNQNYSENSLCCGKEQRHGPGRAKSQVVGKW